jgi:hypothetical protein
VNSAREDPNMTKPLNEMSLDELRVALADLQMQKARLDLQAQQRVIPQSYDGAKHDRRSARYWKATATFRALKYLFGTCSLLEADQSQQWFLHRSFRYALRPFEYAFKLGPDSDLPRENRSAVLVGRRSLDAESDDACFSHFLPPGQPAPIAGPAP